MFKTHSMQVEDAETIVKLTEEMDSTDNTLLEEAAGIIKELNKGMDRFELTQLLSGPYDKEGAVIFITAGAGGTDAQVIRIIYAKQEQNILLILITLMEMSNSLRCIYRVVNSPF